MILFVFFLKQHNLEHQFDKFSYILMVQILKFRTNSCLTMFRTCKLELF